LRVTNDVSPLRHDDAANHEGIELGQDAIDMLLGVHDFEDHGEPLGGNFDRPGVNIAIVTETGYSLEDRGASESFAPQKREEHGMQRFPPVRLGLTQYDSEQHLLAFDASHRLPPRPVYDTSEVLLTE
jgi:hypothetical protein